MLVQNSSSTKFKAHYQELSLVKKIKISNCGPTSPPHQLSTVSVSYIQRISRFLDAIASLVLTYDDDDFDINNNIKAEPGTGTPETTLQTGQSDHREDQTFTDLSKEEIAVSPGKAKHLPRSPTLEENQFPIHQGKEGGKK